MKLHRRTFLAGLASLTLPACAPLGTGTRTTPPGQGGSTEPSFILDIGMTDHWGKKKDGALTLAPSPDGKYLLAMSHSQANNLQVWDLQQKKRLHQATADCGTMAVLAATSPDNM